MFQWFRKSPEPDSCQFCPNQWGLKVRIRGTLWHVCPECVDKALDEALEKWSEKK